MTRTPGVRLLATNDFFGHYFPERTSYGSLPGAEGLKRTVERLRKGRPTVWADAGDFSGGPLAAVSGGTLGFEAASDLGIDVAAAGNHEFDWGVGHLKEHAPKLGFPLLCANADVGLPATALIPTEAGDVGFVGITMPGAELEPRFGSQRDPSQDGDSGPKSDHRLTRHAVEGSRRLRDGGADFVVALLHEGVYVRGTPSDGFALDHSRLTALCRPWAKEVDAIVAGHTIVARWFGHVEGTPVLQPWPFGAEVGVIELSRGAEARAYGVPVEAAGPWTGGGAEVLGRLEAEVIGHLGRSLRFPNVGGTGGFGDLLDFAAGALREAADSDAAVVMSWTGGLNSTQPAVDGAENFLPSGAVTEADLLRLVPWPEDVAVLVDLTRGELEALAARAPIPWRCSVQVREDARPRRPLRVAMTAYTAREAAGWVERRPEPEPSGWGLRDALRTTLRGDPEEAASTG